MLISGIRRKIKIEEDQRRSASFTKHVIKFLTTFAYLGTIFSVLIITDFFLRPYIEYDVVTYKNRRQYIGTYEYYFKTETKRFEANEEFYIHTDPGDQVAFFYAPIFDTLKKIQHQKDTVIYICKPMSIYGWPIITVVLTLICSLIVLTNKGWASEDLLVTVGLLNIFFYIFTLAFLLSK